jgi:hypothetical protein
MKKIREIYANTLFENQQQYIIMNKWKDYMVLEGHPEFYEESFISNIYKTIKERIYGEYWRKIDVDVCYILFVYFYKNKLLYF